MLFSLIPKTLIPSYSSRRANTIFLQWVGLRSTENCVLFLKCFPIAKIAAKLAVGYTLDEIPNDITKETFASFEPTIDYCVVKIPRWTFEKFPETDDILTTAMKSVGETMSIGRTFKEALQKGMRSLEIGRAGFGADGKDPAPGSVTGMDLEYKLSTPNSQRIFYIKYAIEHGMPITMIHELTAIDPWFLHQMKQIVDLEKQLKLAGLNLPKDLFEKAKKHSHHFRECFHQTMLSHVTRKTSSSVVIPFRTFCRPSSRRVNMGFSASAIASRLICPASEVVRMILLICSDSTMSS